jgi:hypothetical protein
MPARVWKQTSPTMRQGPIEANPLARAVAAAQRRRKKEAVTEAMKRSQRATTPGERTGIKEAPSSSLLAHTVAEAKRRRKKEMITAVLKEGRRGA